MANSIAAAERYLARLDAEYKAAAKTSVLDVNPAWVREGDTAGTFYLLSLALVGLGNYGSTFPVGDVTATWDPYTYSQDRARTFSIDKVENDEAAMAVFGSVASEFERMHVVPEIDAYRLSKLATDAGDGDTGAITTSAEAIAATNAALVALANAEVNVDDLVLFATPDILDLHESAASDEKRARILSRATIVEVPQGRLNTEITLNAGSNTAQGGFTATGDEVNFILMDRRAAFADAKHTALRIFSPEVNQSADAYKFDFRIVHDCWVYENRAAGVYAHVAPAGS